MPIVWQPLRIGYPTTYKKIILYLIVLVGVTKDLVLTMVEAHDS